MTLPGGLTVRPGDVVRFNSTTYTLEFDAAANGIPAGVITDAVSEIGPGDLLLSFDVTVVVGGITADDEDLVRFKSGVVSLFFDGSAAGIDPASISTRRTSCRATAICCSPSTAPARSAG